MRIDSAAVDSYRQNGAVLVKDVFEPASLELLARGIERNIERPSKENYERFDGKAGRGSFVMDYGCHRWIPEYLEFIHASQLGEAAAQLLSSRRVCFFDDSYFLKEANSDIPAPWHHDSSYYEIEGEIVVAWVPLDPHGEYETLRLVSGSHRWGKRFWPTEFGSDRVATGLEPMRDAYDRLPDIDGGDYEILAWEVEPGDCVFFNGHTLHGSRGNPTNRAQRRFNCRFLDESAFYSPRSDYPLGDGKAGAKLQPGQRLCEDPESFPVVWEA